MGYAVSPNNKVIESLIGKYESGKITMIYGNSASGKTTSCLLATLYADKDNKVAFIDTESSFSVERLEQLYDGDVKDILDNLLLIQPKGFKEQYDIILELKKICEDDRIKVVIVDTIGHHYRNVLNETPKEVNSMMVEQMASLVRIARDFNKVVLLTNQVYSKMDSTDGIKMVGGSMVPKMCKIIIELRRKDEERFAELKKYKAEDETLHENIGKKIKFEIAGKGLIPV